MRCVGSETAHWLTQHRGELCAVAHGQIGVWQLARPSERTTVHPNRTQPGGARRRDIELRVIADVGNGAGIERELLCQPLEAAPVWLGGADMPGIERHGEDVTETDAGEIRVAVAEGGERILQAQSRQRRRDVGEYLDRIACREEHLEGFRGDILAWVSLAPDGRLARCHVRDPSWLQWPLLEAAIEGNIVAYFPLCNKSFNCSYSGHDL